MIDRIPRNIRLWRKQNGGVCDELDNDRSYPNHRFLHLPYVESLCIDCVAYRGNGNAFRDHAANRGKKRN